MKKGYSSASSHTSNAPMKGGGRPVNWTQSSPGVHSDGQPGADAHKAANIVISRLDEIDASRRY